MSKRDPIAAQQAGGVEQPDPARAIRRLLSGIFIILAIYALYFARDFFMPVLLAFMLAMMLTPIVRFLRKRGVPEAISATALVVVSAVGIGGAGYLVSGPVMQLIADAPAVGAQLQDRLAELRKPVDSVVRASEQLEKVTETMQEPGVQKVVVAQPGILSRAAGNMLSIGTTTAITFVLSLFLLASGTLFYEKIVQSFTLLSDKKRALRIVYDIEREISRYLLTVTVINCGLGAAVALGCWAIGLPNPLVWGAAAALLNFLPYVGALIGMLMVAVISLITFDTLGQAMLAPAFYLVCNILEGQLISPLVVGRRLELNAVSIFIAVAFWSWLWGFAGALLAVPILVIVRVFCDHFEGLRHIGNFLSAQQSATAEETARA